MGMASAAVTRYAGMDHGMSLGLALDLGGSATSALDGRGLPPLLGSHAVAVTASPESARNPGTALTRTLTNSSSPAQWGCSLPVESPLPPGRSSSGDCSAHSNVHPSRQPPCRMIIA